MGVLLKGTFHLIKKDEEWIPQSNVLSAKPSLTFKVALAELTPFLTAGTTHLPTTRIKVHPQPSASSCSQMLRFMGLLQASLLLPFSTVSLLPSYSFLTSYTPWAASRTQPFLLCAPWHLLWAATGNSPLQWRACLSKHLRPDYKFPEGQSLPSHFLILILSTSSYTE